MTTVFFCASVPVARAETTTTATPAKPAATPQATTSAQPPATAKPIALSPVRVRGKADIIDSMKYDPDQDHSAVGKASVLTKTTTFKTFRDRQIDNLEDYARRVDASVNYSEGNSSINIRGLDQNRILTPSTVFACHGLMMVPMRGLSARLKAACRISISIRSARLMLSKVRIPAFSARARLVVSLPCAR
ncbi:hypothetical protein [Acetobacter papayae]|uniref:hypothetical protein n=1 Tax=Acetobacter papayae TaxID=1076592 RepID=UPI001F31E524|nr:hypothetical protein [Acetobacter papayae]